MIYPINDPDEFGRLCLNAWYENTDFWSSTREVDEEVIQFIIQSIPFGSKNLLDIGCGNGWLCQELSVRNSNIEYSGLDYNIGFIQELENKYGTTNFYHLDFSKPLGQEDLPVFDVAVSCLSIIEIASLDVFFRNIQSILSPNGHVILVTLNPYFEILRLSSNYADLQHDFSIYRRDKLPKYYKKEIRIGEEGSGRFYYGVLHTLESLMQQFRLHGLSIIDFKELSFENGALAQPIYNAYTLKLNR